MFSDFWFLIFFKSPLKNLKNNFFLCTKFLIYHGFLHCFDNVLFYMFSATLKNTIKQKYYQTKLEKRMLFHIWQFQLRNTLKFSPKKKINFKKSKTLFFKTTLFLRHFDVVFHMFMLIKKTSSRYKNCSLDKTGEGKVVSDLAISPQKYPKIGTQTTFFFTEFWRRFSHV